MDHGKRQAEHLIAGELDRPRIPDQRAHTTPATATYAATPTHLQPMPRLGATRRDDETACDRRAARLALPNPIVPTMVLPDGCVPRGLGALSRLQRYDGRRT